MKDGLRFVDSDMHVMEPPDLFERYLDPTFKDRISVPVGVDGRPCRGPAGLILIDGLPTSDADLQQYRKRRRPGPTQSTQPLSGSRIADTGRLDFAVERDYNAEAQVMGMEMEGVDIAVCASNSLDAIFFERWLEEGVHLSSIKQPEIEVKALQRLDLTSPPNRMTGAAAFALLRAK